MAAASPCAAAAEALVAAEGEPDAVVAGDEEYEVPDPGRAVFCLLIPIRILIEKGSEK